MVIFDSTLPGTTAAIWRADERFAQLPGIDLDTTSTLVVIGAHPDDETLGAGALVRQAAARGIRTDVVIVTDGAASHPLSSTTTPQLLAAARAAEVGAAIAELAPGAKVTLLGFPDGAVLGHRDAIGEELLAMVNAAVTATVAQGGVPADVLVVAPWRGDGHRDHRVAGEIAAAISTATGARLLEYPVWMWHWATPAHPDVPWARLQKLEVGPVVAAAKSRAIAAHASQVKVLSDLPGDEAVLDAGFLEHFAGDEVFVTAPAESNASGAATSLPAAYFDELYERHDDPWQFQTRWYETRKRALTLAALPDERYGSVLEIGCSIGVLTEQLAARADRLLAIDVSGAAVSAARERLAGQGHVDIEIADVGAGLPAGPFDLIVLSEVGYYFNPAGFEGVLGSIGAELSENGTLLACHWRHAVDGYLQGGDDVHAAIDRRADYARVGHYVDDDFVLDVFTRDGRSVAERTGLL